MAFNKSKALEEAARLVSQRKLPQAIKQYQAIIEQDPQDLPLRNIVGDLWVREGNAREAVREFHTLAESYTREGFILKAIAIYKKIVKLDADSPAALVRLAELYAGQKFSHEANEQYAQALAICERRGLHDHAGQILRKLVARDPENTVYQTRLGEFLQRTGQPQEACQAFLQAAESAYQRKNISGAVVLLKKAAELEPENPHMVLFRATLAAQARDFAEVERIFQSSPGMKSDAEGCRVLLGAYLDSGRLDDAAALALDAFRAAPQNLDAVKQFAAHGLEAGTESSASSVLRLLNEINDLAFERNQAGELFDLLQPVLARHPSDAAALDLAERLCERAGRNRTPTALLEVMGKGFAETGQWTKAEHAFQSLVGRNPVNSAWQASLKEAIEKQGRSASAQSTGPEATATEGSRQGGTAAHIEAIEVDFSTEWETFTTGRPAETPTAAGASPEPALEAVQESSPQPPLESLPQPEVPPPSGEELAASDSGVAAPYAFDRRFLEGEDLPEAAAPTAAGPDLNEEISQVEFYLSSGFLGEANTALSDLARSHPGHAEILELQARLEAARAASFEPADAVLDEPPAVASSEISEQNNIYEIYELEGSSELRPPSSLNEEEQSPAMPDPQPLAEEEPVMLPAELGPGFQFQGGSLLGDLAEDLARALEETDGQSPAAEGGPARAVEKGEDGRSLFDSSLEELLTELEAGQPAAPAADTPQTHYNLGVAFREMGLLDEAIGEFQKVVKGRIPEDHPPRFLEASSMLGNCFMEKQMPEIAARWYDRALQTPGLQEEIALALTYDLATACERSGNLKAAREKFAEIYSLNIDYRDVAEKIQSLSRSKLA
ncbi:MAG TPA: tetratricopeptide repeat protein [Terriglobia bacterium]|nr:tetratricopeptide repeat protein [Terriglobia bacterium]